MDDILGDMVNKDAAMVAMINDQRLIKLAEYAVSNGYMRTEGITNELLQSRFVEFKSLVLRKESTLAELEATVYNTYGVMENFVQPKSAADTPPKKEILGFNVTH